VQNVEANEDGEFNMTVPYSTEGYDEYGPENGYTNVSVRATGNYSIVGSQRVSADGDVVASVGQFDVGEGQVNGDNPEAVTVELSERTLLNGDSGDGANTIDDEASPDDSGSAVSPTTDNSANTESAGIGHSNIDADDRQTIDAQIATTAPIAVTGK
jgi:dolichyl-diphosphooligosaccharide--protein glycosyltransferase